MRFVHKLLSQWTLHSSSGLHLSFLDGLRGLAILMVVVAHGVYANPDGPRSFIAIAHLTSTGGLGVQMFFALSGFLISYPFFRRRQRGDCFSVPRGYAWRRALKVFPPFYLAILLLSLFYFWHTRDPSYFPLGLQWASGWAAFVNCPKYFNTSFWSLWVEIQFYVVLPLLFLLGRKCSVRVAGWCLFGLLLIGPFLTRGLTWPQPGDPDFAFLMRRFPSALDGFAWGVLFAALFTLHPPDAHNRRLARLGYAGLALLACGLVALAGSTFFLHLTDWSRFLFEGKKLLPGLACFLIMFFAYDAHSAGARLLASPLLRFVGMVSFEWFLLHQPMQNFARELAVSAQGNPLRYLAVVGIPSGLTLVVAVLIYHCFSHPILNWGRGRLEESRLRTSPSSMLAGNEDSARPD